MGRRRWLYVLATAAAVLLAPGIASLGAQRLAVGSGISLPRGDLARHAAPGPMLVFGFETPAVLGPLSLRINTGTAMHPVLPTMGSETWVYSLQASAILRRTTGRLEPYALLGAGMYGQNSVRSFAPGIHAGLGLEWRRSSARPFVELGAHKYREAGGRFNPDRAIMVPVTIGLRF